MIQATLSPLCTALSWLLVLLIVPWVPEDVQRYVAVLFLKQPPLRALVSSTAVQALFSAWLVFKVYESTNREIVTLLWNFSVLVMCLSHVLKNIRNTEKMLRSRRQAEQSYRLYEILLKEKQQLEESYRQKSVSPPETPQNDQMFQFQTANNQEGKQGDKRSQRLERRIKQLRSEMCAIVKERDALKTQLGEFQFMFRQNKT